jgi:uncharacterized membrane protein
MYPAIIFTLIFVLIGTVIQMCRGAEEDSPTHVITGFISMILVLIVIYKLLML